MNPDEGRPRFRASSQASQPTSADDGDDIGHIGTDDRSFHEDAQQDQTHLMHLINASSQKHKQTKQMQNKAITNQLYTMATQHSRGYSLLLAEIDTAQP